MSWESSETAKITTPEGDKEVRVGADFASAVKKVATDLGYGKFRVFVSGEEVMDPDEAPETISADDNIEIQPFDKGK